MARSLGLGNFRAAPQADRLPSQATAELIRLRDTADMVRGIGDQVHGIADDIDPFTEAEVEKPDFVRGDFDANLAEELSQDDRSRIASELLRGIEADLASRKDWEAMVERAIKFLGLIYEEASGEATSEGSISKAWHTLMLESSIGFWANAYAEFLPAAGPVKVRDDSSPLEPEAQPSRLTPTQLAEAFEKFFNHYLTVVDRQYYRDFSRMLFSLGPKGTEFRKIYYHPLRRMVVSEWVKSENLIVSNDAADLSTAGRITERILMRNADVKRMQWKGHWLDVPLTTPVNTPTQIEETVARSEGIQARISLPADWPHTIYECCCELDLPGFEHTDEDGDVTGLPLPYRVTLDRDSRQILEIRRHWKEDDEDFKARQRYVMFGLLPGFGLYFLGYAHVLGNTERALTALEREVIDNTMLSIFPGWFAAKGAFSRGETQIRLGVGGVKEVDLQMQKSVNDVVQPIAPPQIGPAVLALFEKLEQNGRAVSGKFDVPVGEGTANIPVGTMIAMIENGTKMMLAVHKGLHAARAQEFELMRELMAEDPESMIRWSKDQVAWDELVEELLDLDLVPSSDPNTPSHVHRILRFVGLGQLAQMFPDLANRLAIYQEGLAILQIGDISRFTNPNPGAAGADPKAGDAQVKLQVAQLNAQSRERDTQARAQTTREQIQGKLQEAQLDLQGEQAKAQAQVQQAVARQHDSAQERAADAIDANQQRAHDLAKQQLEHEHAAREGHLDRVFPSAVPPRAF